MTEPTLNDKVNETVDATKETTANTVDSLKETANTL